MTRLLTEIWLQIFFFLNQEDKVACMTVCKHWEHLIKSHCLYKTVHLTTYQQVQHLMERLEQEPYHRSQLENLIMDHCANDGSYFQLNQLLTTLPYLRVLYIHSKTQCFKMADPEQLPWSRSIEVLILGDQLLAGRCFTYNVFDKLKVLVMNGRHVPSSTLLWMLEKAPALEDLRLEVYWFSILDVEDVHARLPKLRHFTLELNHVNSDALPHDIQPNPLVSSVSIRFTGTAYVEDRLAWFKYIPQKYTHVSEIQYHEETILNPSGHQEVRMSTEIEQGFRLFIRRLGPKLKKLDIKAQVVPFDLFTMMDQSSLTCSALSIESNQLRHLIKPFMNSEQTQHIQKLQLEPLHTDSLPCLSCLPRLKELALRFSNGGLSADIGYILDLCPESLESLELRNIKLTSISKPFKISSLRSLSIMNGKLNQGVDVYLAHSLPSLGALTLMRCIYHDKRLALSQISLSTFEMGLLEPCVVIHTSKDEKRCLYVAKDDDADWSLLNGYRQTDGYPFYHPARPCMSSELEEYPENCLTVECESVNDVFVFTQK